MMPIASCKSFPFSTPCDDMLSMLACATCWLSVHFYTLAYMSMHEFCLLVCRPCFNTMKLWISDPNLHFSPHGHHLLFAFSLVCLFGCLLAFQLLCLPCLSTLCIFICSLHLFLLLLVCQFLVFAFACTHMERGRLELGHSLLSVSKKGTDASMQRQAKWHVQQIQEFSLSFWVMYALKSIPSSSLSLLDGLYQVYHAVYHSSSSLEYGDLCLFSCTYILGHTLRIQTFTFLLYVLALCTMYVYIYLLAPPSVIVIVHVMKLR